MLDVGRSLSPPSPHCSQRFEAAGEVVDGVADFGPAGAHAARAGLALFCRVLASCLFAQELAEIRDIEPREGRIVMADGDIAFRADRKVKAAGIAVPAGAAGKQKRPGIPEEAAGIRD